MALRYGRSAVSLARTLQNPRFLVEGLFYGAISEAFFGNPNLALELADEAFDLASTRHEPRHMYKSGWARGCALAALGQTQEAIAVLQQAYRIAVEVGARLHENRIRFRG